MSRRLGALAAAVAALSLLAAPAAALAAPSDHFTSGGSGTVVVADICLFPVTLAYTQFAIETDRYDNEGNFVGLEVTIREQDTFRATHTLISEPFTFHLSYRLDKDGELVQLAYSGALEKVRLPDGRMFVVAGRSAFPDVEFVIVSPDSGHTPNIDAFCDALA